MAITGTEIDIIKAAKDTAVDLAVRYDIPSHKTYHGRFHYLVAARRTKSGMSATYHTAEAIVNAYNKALVNAAQPTS